MKTPTKSKTSPKGGKRGCLCPDGKYSPECCNGEDWVREEILWIENTEAPIVWIDDWNWWEVRKGVEESGSRYQLERTSPNGDVAITLVQLVQHLPNLEIKSVYSF